MPAQFDTLPEQKIAYLVMRKCGCSSIMHAFSRIRDRQPVPQSAIEIHRKRDFNVFAPKLEAPSSWFKFTIVRDPISRFISFYANKILDQNLDHNHTFFSRDRFGLLPNMAMDQVIEIMMEEKFEIEPHIAPQADLIKGIGYELDFIGRLENMAGCLDHIESKTGVRLPLQHLNEAKQKPVVPTRSQFEKLARFYQSDISEFGYPNDFDTWYQTRVEGREQKYQMEAGFTFENEAKLLKQSVSRQSDRFVIELRWRVHENQSRKRVIQILRRRDKEFEIVWHLPPRFGLIENCDEHMIVEETVDIPFSRMPEDADLNDIYHCLYFADKGRKRALLTDYLAHDNMLVFAFGHLNQKS